jgi:serine protease Do
VVVSDVVDGSPADEVGIRRGDVILEVNQEPITTVGDYQSAVEQAGDAGALLFLVRRDDSVRYVALRPVG